MIVTRKTDICQTNEGKIVVLFKEFDAVSHKGKLVGERVYEDLGDELLADIREFVIDGTQPSRGG